MPELAGPVGAKDRIAALDVIRGFALFGVLWMNILGFAYPFGAYFSPVYLGDPLPAEMGVWIFSDLFVEGAMRTLFSILFGAGAYVILSRAEAKVPESFADIYFRRCVGLILLGVFHAYVLLWFGDFLYLYGVIGLLLFPVRKLKPVFLLALALGFVAVMTVKNVGNYKAALEAHAEYAAAAEAREAGDELSEEQTSAIESWERREENRQPPAETIQKTVDIYQGSYADIFTYLQPRNKSLQSTILYSHQLWDIAGMMLIGMALFKLGVFNGGLSYRTYLLMAVVGIGGALAVNGYEVRLQMAAGFDALSSSQARATYDVGRIGLAVGYVGVFMALIKAGWLGFIFKPLAAAGRMALTHYVMHSVIGAIIFYGFGFGLFGELARHELYYIVAAIIAGQIAMSVIWLKFLPYGPLEWLLRAFAYWRPRMRGAATDTASA